MGEAVLLGSKAYSMVKLARLVVMVATLAVRERLEASILVRVVFFCKVTLVRLSR